MNQTARNNATIYITNKAELVGVTEILHFCSAVTFLCVPSAHTWAATGGL